MRIKSFLAVSVLSASTFLSAAAQADYDSNFLLGLEFGYARQHENFTTGFVAPTLAPLAITSYNNQTYNISDEILMYGLVGGWQWRCCRFMAGLEANVDFHTMTEAKPFVFSVFSGGVTDIFSATALYDRGPIFGLTTRAGYFVAPQFFPYLRAGVQVSRDEGSYQVFANPQGVNQQSDFISSGKEDVWGIVLGIGAEFPALIGPSTIRVEYNFTKTESIVIEDGTAPIFGTHKFRYPQTNVIKVGWIWNFL